jgi:hypothetical protein
MPRKPARAAAPKAENPRLARAVAFADRLADALPPPVASKARPVRIVLALSEAERDKLAAVATKRGEPLATATRTLAVTYAELLLEKG